MLALASVPVVLLKGPALAEWYSGRPHPYLDCDLWLAPETLQRAGAVLERRGFTPRLDEQLLPEWWRSHATTWARAEDGALVDLHSRLQGVGVDPQTAWCMLERERRQITVAGYPAAALSLPAQALYVTLHAANHGNEWGKAINHVERALDAVDENGWRHATELAGQLDALEGFAAGLRLLPSGTALAARLGLPASRSVEVALRASTPPPAALSFAQIAGARTVLERLEIVFRKAFPPAAFIRHWWPPAARSHAMLIVGYLYRPLWLARNAPRGYRAWRRARRSVSGRD